MNLVFWKTNLIDRLNYAIRNHEMVLWKTVFHFCLQHTLLEEAGTERLEILCYMLH